METLSTLFGSQARIKLLRLFLLNGTVQFSVDEMIRKAQVKLPDAKVELKLLEKAKIIKKKSVVRDVEVTTKKQVPVGGAKMPKKGSRKKVPMRTVTTTREVRKKVDVWNLDSSCDLVPALRSLLVESELIKSKDIAKRLTKSGNIKLLVLSGIFVKDGNDKVDIVVVGDKLDQKHFLKSVQQLEAEIGKELKYSLFSPEDFAYRMQMFDKYLIDVFSGPHEKLIHKMEIPRG